MRLRFMHREATGWEKDKPADPSKWLWQHDGQEAVCVDDETETYYCGLPSMINTYREAWEKERRVGDKRRASTFYELDRKLWESEQNAA